MGALVQGGNKSSKLVPDNCIRIGLYEYTRQSSVYSEVFAAEKLLVAQLTTSLQPMKGLVEKYGQAMSGEEDPPPATIDEVGDRFKAGYRVRVEED
jgi:hypothetical protein